MATPKLRFKEFDGDWFQSKIGEIFQVTSGSTPLRSDNRFFENADIAWVKTTDLNNGLIEKTEEKISQIALKETSVKILPKGTVFVAMYGGFNQIGRTGLLVHEAACNQALSAIYPNEKIDSYFLLTFLNHKVDDWKNFAASSRKDPNITKSDVLAFPLKYPVKEEQTKIASFLSTVDEKISQLTQKHELLNQYKQGMMQKLFSQQIRFKADDGSEFGEWENGCLGDITAIQGGYAFKSNSFGKGATKVLRIGDIRNNIFLDCFNGVYSEEIPDARYVVSKDAIVMALSGATFGKLGKVVTGSAYLNQRVATFKVNEKTTNEYVYQVMLSKEFFNYIQSIPSASAQPNISNQDVINFEILIPCLEEQTKIANFLSAIDQKIEVVAQQIEQAKTWKKGLLQQMFI
ncbi:MULTISPECIES: restriction endonuclease subunit S [Acinetobacter]|uniref:Type I restriction modification DNA specificity domain protein n=2 Tax=Acinetobacter baumannii TaxID=470 RepID=A0A062HXS1_ACIBA|nr:MULTISPECIES: restriction endonuclease subunit S [Acinetobacter]EKX0188516.1 restriction endonuclease subunit S [Acinetobacter baumannii]KCY13709.1 type I restriction modification DNA specificity domain protein [Acinetobacter baumannii 21072]MBD8350519.1 restriction endonuclease subunit S [Acinetobacter nosocomialis]MBJ8493932.1 restriction endonuclease subunit S [Acinetobacter nosocomialis]MBJ9707364.1 restriction endonuclease subunit S [Acinetobacter baumannii]